MAISLNVSDGKQEFYVQGDPNRAIWINTNDTGISTRAHRAQKQIQQMSDRLEEAAKQYEGKEPDDAYFELLEEADKQAKDALNYAFASDIADTVFGLISPYAIVREDGTIFFNDFLNSILPYIEKGQEDMKGKVLASRQRTGKYTNKYARNSDAQ